MQATSFLIRTVTIGVFCLITSFLFSQETETTYFKDAIGNSPVSGINRAKFKRITRYPAPEHKIIEFYKVSKDKLVSYEEFQKGYASGEWIICNAKGNHLMNFDYEKYTCQFSDMRKMDSAENTDVWYPWGEDNSYWASVRGEDTVYLLDKVDHPANFQGGQDELVKFLSSQLKYPSDAKTMGIQGIVYVSFLIEKTGKIKNVCLMISKHPLLDKAALDLISSMPNWNPGSHLGRLVKTGVAVPVKFSLR